METLDKYKIDLKGMSQEACTYEFLLDDEFFTLIDAPEVQKGNVKVSLNVKRLSQAFELNFQTEGIVKLICDRCLDEMNQPVHSVDRLVVKLGDEYVRMKGTQFRGTDTIPVGFDVLVELEESERISITDSKLGRQRYFSLTSDSQVQELYEGDVEMTVPVSGVYHVGMDFVTKEAFFSKVEQVDLIVLQNGKPDDVVTTLEYEGNYVWGSQYTALLSDGSALPNGAAYKFRMTESSGKVTYWGSSSKMVNPPTEDTASSYFYVTKVSEGMSNFYRFPILVSGKQMNVMLSMAPSEENWYHTNN